jgi:multiple sugar transport system permease protein
MSDLTADTLVPIPAAPAGRVRHHAARAAPWLVTPAVVAMLVLLIGPVVAVAVMSFTDYQLGAPSFDFVWLDNYRDLFADRVFWRSLGNTLAYAAFVVPVSMAVGLGAALLIEAGEGWKSFYRAVFFIPVMATTIAMAMSWEYMLHPQFGLINLVLARLGLPTFNWLNEPALVLPTLAMIGVWQLFGFNMVLFLAGLTAIPRNLYEAARLDGAGDAWSRFRLVTWPMLRPVTMFVVVVSAIRSFQVFDTVQVLTKGGPSKASEVLLYTMYSEGFEFFRSGRAAAIAVVFLGLVLILTVIKARILDDQGASR